MDDFCLPMAFGKKAGLPPKPSAAEKPAPIAVLPQQPRGETGGRGARGVVGGGKKSRGRGRGGMRDAGWGQRIASTDASSSVPASIDEQGSSPALKSGTKRPGPPSPGHGVPQDDASSPFRSTPAQFGRGEAGRGRGGRGGGTRGGGQDGSRENVERGFFKQSFCEDPWKELEERRARSRV
ncbi:hypothetical protein IAU60_003043 [Kwoniella sp. DSM 27419]